MKKIPTIFERDWNGDRSRVTRVPNPACQWVFDGEGVATRKYDGACCMVRDGKLYKRRELGPKQSAPTTSSWSITTKRRERPSDGFPSATGRKTDGSAKPPMTLPRGLMCSSDRRFRAMSSDSRGTSCEPMAPRSAITTSRAPSTAWANGSMTAISRGSSSIIPTDAWRRSSCGIRDEAWRFVEAGGDRGSPMIRG